MNLKPHKDFPDSWKLVKENKYSREFIVPIQENTKGHKNEEWNPDEWINYDSGIE